MITLNKKEVENNLWHVQEIDFDGEVVNFLNDNGKTNFLTKGIDPNFVKTNRKFLFGENPETGDNVFYNVVSHNYVTVRHADLLDRAEDYIVDFGDNIGYDGKITEKVSYNYNGKYMFAEFIFDDMKFKIRDENEVAFRVVINNGYGSKGILLDMGAYRFVCANGLIVGERFAREVIRHFYNDEEIIQKLQMKLEKFDKVVDKWRKWVNEKMSIEDARKYLESRKLSKRWLAAIMYNYDASREKTKWDFYNAITYVLTHDLILKYKKDRVELARQRLANIILKGF